MSQVNCYEKLNDIFFMHVCLKQTKARVTELSPSRTKDEVQGTKTFFLVSNNYLYTLVQLYIVQCFIDESMFK